MDTKTQQQRKNIIKAYMQHVLEHNTQPTNIYKFSVNNDMEESDFYKFFTSFESLEIEIFNEFFNETIDILEKNEEYHDFTAQNKLLSFYFTFFEILTKNRSYTVFSLGYNKLRVIKMTSALRQSFKEYIDSLDLGGPDFKNDKLDRITSKGTSEAYWGQLVLLINFWMNDTSPDFEKTDILIEKMVVTGFKLQNTEPLDSIIDLGKFLLKEVKTY